MAFVSDALYVAVDTTLTNTAALTSRLTLDQSTDPDGVGIFAAGEVPEGQLLESGGLRWGYVVLGASGETPNDMFGAEGSDGTLRIAVHSDNKKHALFLAGVIHRALHNKPLTITGHALVEGSCLLIRDFEDPGGGYTAHLQYAAFTLVTA